MELPSGKAFCQWTLDDIQRIVSKERWAEMRVGRFSLSSEGFAAYQKFIERACEKYKCSTEEKHRMLMKMEGFYEVLASDI